MGVTATVRQAKLRPECADRYPTLPVRMLTSAARLAELVAAYRRALQNGGRSRRCAPSPRLSSSSGAAPPAGWAG
jgi:hypothetical protein